MKKTAMVFVMILIFSVITLNLNAQTNKISTLGRSPLYGWVEDAETARMVVKKELGATKYALNMTYGLEQGNKIFFALCEQIDEAIFSKRAIFPRMDLDWMLFRSKGFQRVLQNVEWAGDECFEAFSFAVFEGDMLYRFVVPRPCGNISLWYEMQIIINKVEEPKKLKEPEEKQEEIVKIDEPEIIEEDIETSLPTSRKTNGFGGMAASMTRNCYIKHLPNVVIGLKHNLSRDVSFEGTIGIGMPFEIMQSKGQPYFFTGVSLNYRFGKFLSSGLGIGFSSAARSNHRSYGELIWRLGFFKDKIFFETRIPFSKLDNIGEFPDIHHKFMLGFRFPLKK